jgi:NADH-quinone oxidoreductase subunit N
MEYVTPLYPAYAELFLLGATVVILLVDLFLAEERRGVTYALTLVALAGAFAFTLLGPGTELDYAFSGMFVADLMANVLKLILYVTVAMVMVYSRGYLRERGLYRGEFFVLTLFATLGMMVLISANHLLILYLGVELLALSLYALVALQRDSAVATEAAMKYFVLGALASGMLLYGMSMIYGATGSLEITRIQMLVAEGEARGLVLLFGLVFVIAGLGFKLGAVPFHMWVPDVYQGAPTAVTLFIGSAPKLAAFAFLMRLLGQTLESQFLFEQWQPMLIVMAVLSMALGNLTAIVQNNVKRMLAYSAIAHMGFMLLGVLAGDVNGYSAAMFYVVVYVLMSLGAFGMVLLLARKGFEADTLDDFRGLNRRSPWFAFVMLLVMFSMTGIPPTAGFYAKLAVLEAAVQSGFVWLAVAAVLFSLVGAFYYLRIVKLMYFDEPLDASPVEARADMRALLSANGLALLVFGILPQPLMGLCLYAIQFSL